MKGFKNILNKNNTNLFSQDELCKNESYLEFAYMFITYIYAL